MSGPDAPEPPSTPTPAFKPRADWKRKFISGACNRIAASPVAELEKVLSAERFLFDQAIGDGLLVEADFLDQIGQARQACLLANKQAKPAPKRKKPARPMLPEGVGPQGLASRPFVLVPGMHVTDNGEQVEVGMAQFTAGVLSKLPDGCLYERAGIVGQVQDGKFHPLSATAMRYVIDRDVRLARWRRDQENGGQYMSFEHCLADWAGVVHAMAPRHPKTRALRMITPHPVYTADGVSQPGYHNGIYYSGPEIKPSDEDPTPLLDDLMVDFPFASRADKHNAFGLIVTCLVAPMCPTRPMHVVMSSMPRTGKTKLVEEVIGGLVLGNTIGAMQLTGNEDEREKRLMSLAIAGDTLCHLDNIGEFLNSASLCSMLTAERLRGRILGQSTMVTVANNLIAIASANNLKATDEISKRSVPIVLQSSRSDPENRTGFTHPNLRAYVLEQRPRVLAAILGLIARSRFDGSIPLGGFEDWARIVGGVARVWPDWLTNRAEWLTMTDERTEELKGFVSAWRNALTLRDVTARELLTVAKAGDFFPFILCKPDEASQLASLGKLLARHQGSIVDGCKILRSGTPNKRKFALDLVDEV